MPFRMLVRRAMAKTASKSHSLCMVFISLTLNASPSASCNSTFGPMFDSLPTLHNCFIFPNVTTKTSASTINLAQQLHYLDPEHNATATNVVQTLGKCLSKYYETLPNYDPTIFLDHPTLYNYETSQSLNTSSVGYGGIDGFGQYLVRQICAGIPTSINSDVGGVGVS